MFVESREADLDSAQSIRIRLPVPTQRGRVWIFVWWLDQGGLGSMGGPKFVDENEAEKATADSAKASCLESFPQPATWPMVTEWAESAIALFEACGLGGDYQLVHVAAC